MVSVGVLRILIASRDLRRGGRIYVLVSGWGRVVGGGWLWLLVAVVVVVVVVVLVVGVVGVVGVVVVVVVVGVVVVDNNNNNKQPSKLPSRELLHST